RSNPTDAVCTVGSCVSALCCEDAPTCADFAEGCPPSYVLILDPKATTCSGAICSASECCTPAAPCSSSSVDCGTGYFQNTDPYAFCAGDVCDVQSGPPRNADHRRCCIPASTQPYDCGDPDGSGTPVDDADCGTGFKARPQTTPPLPCFSSPCYLNAASTVDRSIDHQRCCEQEPQATCGDPSASGSASASPVSCGAGYQYNPLAADAVCNSNPCDTASADRPDHIMCCVGASTVNPFDCTRFPGPLQIISYDNANADPLTGCTDCWTVKQLDLVTSQYTLVADFGDSSDLGGANPNAASISPIDGKAYAVASQHLFRFDSDLNIEYVMDLGEGSVSGTFDFDGNYFYNPLPQDTDPMITFKKITAPHRLTGHTARNDAVQCTLAPSPPECPELVAEVCKVDSNGPTCSSMVQNSLLDLVPVRLAPADYPESTFSWVFALKLKNNVGPHDMIGVRADCADDTQPYCGNDAVIVLHSDSLNPGVPQSSGAAWAYDGTMYYSANSGSFLTQIRPQDITINSDNPSAGQAHGTFSFTLFGNSEPTDQNDGLNCPAVPSPFATCSDKNGFALLPSPNNPVLDSDCPSGYFSNSAAVAASAVCTSTPCDFSGVDRDTCCIQDISTRATCGSGNGDLGPVTDAQCGPGYVYNSAAAGEACSGVYCVTEVGPPRTPDHELCCSPIPRCSDTDGFGAPVVCPAGTILDPDAGSLECTGACSGAVSGSASPSSCCAPCCVVPATCADKEGDGTNVAVSDSDCGDSHEAVDNPSAIDCSGASCVIVPDAELSTDFEVCCTPTQECIGLDACACGNPDLGKARLQTLTLRYLAEFNTSHAQDPSKVNVAGDAGGAVLTKITVSGVPDFLQVAVGDEITITMQ
ncbi:MAG: hypothetical protein VX223_06350, partial [Myxococcota bacterium]|nr:hypothetical protein [Myxococcota bacterium]